MTACVMIMQLFVKSYLHLHRDYVYPEAATNPNPNL